MWTRDAYNVNNKKQARLTLLWILLEEGKREPGCRDVSWEAKFPSELRSAQSSEVQKLSWRCQTAGLHLAIPPPANKTTLENQTHNLETYSQDFAASVSLLCWYECVLTYSRRVHKYDTRTDIPRTGVHVDILECTNTEQSCTNNFPLKLVWK